MSDEKRMGCRGWLALVVVLLVGTLVGVPVPLGSRGVAAAADPVLAAAGDIACDPGDSNFNGGAGTAGACHMGAVSDLLAGGGLAGVLALGDDQYDDATLAKFQQSYDPGWGRVKALTHPVPGNHEYKTDPAAAGYFGYYGAAAGDPARGYYSFDVGAWHLVVLNANCAAVGGCQAGSAQEQWLRADLAAHPAACTLAAWHQPRFSSGFVGGTTDVAAFWDDLYAARAALVLNGHDHDYERFAPQDPGGAADPGRGIREFVVGTGGKDLNHGFAAPLATSEVRDAATFGALRLTLHPTGYDWQFVPDASGTFTDAGSGACPAASPSPSPRPSASPSPSPSPSASPSPSPSPSSAVRVNAGGAAYTGGGVAWAADSGFTGGSASSTGAAIAGTTDAPLYQTERWGTTFSYRFAVPNGTYTVTLKFAEIYWTQPGQRVFNVALNGQAVLTNFDILAQVAPNTALDKSFTVTVTGGTLTAAFTTVTDAAKLSAIAIVPGTSPSPSPSPSASPSPSPSPSASPSPSPSPSPVPPTVTALSPTAGPATGGTTVTINGNNLTGATRVSFGGTAATITANSATTVTATTPAHAVGTVDVTVTTAGGTSATSQADLFAYIARPVVTKLKPTGGPASGNTTVTISGSGFTGATNVSFGGTTATFTVNSSSQITAVAPAHGAGTVSVTVTTAGGTSATSSNDQYTYR